MNEETQTIEPAAITTRIETIAVPVLAAPLDPDLTDLRPGWLIFTTVSLAGRYAALVLLTIPPIAAAGGWIPHPEAEALAIIATLIGIPALIAAPVIAWRNR